MGHEDDEPLPPRGETVVRSTGRMLPVRPDGRVLLLHGWDPDTPEEPFFFSIGGGIDPGETHLDAAVRETFEETGIVVRPRDVTSEIARYDIDFLWAGRRIIQDLVFFAVPVPDGTTASLDGLTALEADSIGKAAWLSPDELAASGQAPDDRFVHIMRLAVAAVLGGDAAAGDGTTGVP